MNIKIQLITTAMCRTVTRYKLVQRLFSAKAIPTKWRRFGRLKKGGVGRLQCYRISHFWDTLSHRGSNVVTVTALACQTECEWMEQNYGGLMKRVGLYLQQRGCPLAVVQPGLWEREVKALVRVFWKWEAVSQLGRFKKHLKLGMLTINRFSINRR